MLRRACLMLRRSSIASRSLSVVTPANRTKESIEFRILDDPPKEMREKVIDTVAKGLCLEPTSQHLAARAGYADCTVLYPVWKKFFTPFMDELCNNNMSVVAVDVEKDEEIAGVSAVRDYAKRFPRESDAALITSVLAPLHWLLIKKADAYFVQQNPSMHLAGVPYLGTSAGMWILTNEAYKKQGLTHALCDLSLAQMKVEGFERAVCNATNDHFKKAMEKHGFEVAVARGYKNFMFEGRHPFAGMEEPHTHFSLMEKKLGTSTSKLDFDHKPIDKWTPEDVEMFVLSRGESVCWKEYAETLRKNHVDGQTLAVYDEVDELVEDGYGIRKNHARVLLKAIRRAREREPLLFSPI